MSVAPSELLTVWEGRWRSNNPMWGGWLTVEVTSVSEKEFVGTILFQNSGCPFSKPFKGRIEDTKFVLVADLGGRCGEVKLELLKTQQGLQGSYRADYPDTGQVWLSPRK